MTKPLPYITKEFSEPFKRLNMLTVHKCSDLGLFVYLSNSAFYSV